MDMNTSRRQWVLGGAVLVLVIALIYGFSSSGIGGKYKGMNLTREVEISDDMRYLVESRIKVSRAALDAQEAAGEDVDLNLYLSITWDAHLLGDLVLGRETYEEFLELNSLHQVSWNNYANVLANMGDIERAEAAYKEAYTLLPSEEFYRDYIEFIDEHSEGERIEEIKTVLEEAIQLVGQTPYFMIRLAGYYEDRGECTEMNAHLKVVKTQLPDNEGLANDIIKANENCLANK